ncbi:MAG: hypothetical protein CMB63_07215 [Euryarchaeota archaeon]|nr:hypothetical protein [Euryarchaeota archaeon]
MEEKPRCGGWLMKKDLLDSNPSVSTPNSFSRQNRVVRRRETRGRVRTVRKVQRDGAGLKQFKPGTDE